MAKCGANEKYEYYRTRGENSVDTPFHFQVIKCVNYTHKSKYVLPVKPSPNLPEIQSIYLYPTTCLFEGITLSEGRGTEKPFEYMVILHCKKICFHLLLLPMKELKAQNIMVKYVMAGTLVDTRRECLKKVNNKIQLKWLIDAYKIFPGKDSFS